eukprot:2188902-Rhodomonas_salina.1
MASSALSRALDPLLSLASSSPSQPTPPFRSGCHATAMRGWMLTQIGVMGCCRTEWSSCQTPPARAP